MTCRRLALLGLLVVAAGGCGDKGVAVTGTVTLGGHPLSAGYVTFEPEAGSGTTGPGATAPVTDGRFEVPADKKLPPGRYTIRIGPPTVGSETPKAAMIDFPVWETKAELKAGDPPLSFDVPYKK